MTELLEIIIFSIGEPIDATFEIKTTNGMGIVIVENGISNLVTWVDNDKLRPEQKKQKIPPNE